MPKLDKVPQFYYHISVDDLGKRKQFIPGVRENIPLREPAVKRICVAPTVSHCLIAISIFSEEAFVYRTLRKVKSHYPFGVWDAKTTKEKWLLKPTTFIKVNSISETTLSFIEELTWGFVQEGNEKSQKHYLKIFNNIFHDDGNLKTFTFNSF